MSERLKPCPFCGSTEAIAEQVRCYDWMKTPWRGQAACASCFASGPLVWRDTQEEAERDMLAGWNRESPVPPVREVSDA